MPTLARPAPRPTTQLAPTPQYGGGDCAVAQTHFRPAAAAILLLAGLAACASRSGGDSDEARPSVAATASAPPQDAAPAPSIQDAPDPAADAADTEPSDPPPPAVVERRTTPPTDLPAGYLALDRACEPGKSVTVAAVGDLLLHRELQKQAFRSEHHFQDLWPAVQPLIEAADVAYANLEGPTAPGIDRWRRERKDPGMVFDNKVYSGYARFNYHPSLAADLIATGFDVVSTANNHSLDRGALGVDRTLDALDAAKLPYTGTRRQGDTKSAWHTVTEVDGIRIAWLACTLHTNYEKDELGQVLRCFDDPKEVPRLVAKLNKRKDIDAVIVTPHWGKEYRHQPVKKQRRLAQAIFDAGAIAIVGSHPHVLQPWELLKTADGKQGFAMFSLGNFASHQRDLPRRSSVILYLGLTQGDDGEVWVNGARYVPITVRTDEAQKDFFVEPVDGTGDTAEVFDHIEDLMGAPNRLAVGETLRTNPQCFSDWTAPSESAKR